MAPVIDKMLANGVEILPPQEDLYVAQSSLKRLNVPPYVSAVNCRAEKERDYQEPLLAAGYELVEDVTKDLHYLVLADAGSTSTKAVKARKLGVRVITEEERHTC